MRRNVLPNLQDRQNASADARKAMLEKFRASPGPDDPAVVERRAAREAMLAERAARAAQREAAKRAHEAELAEQAARAAAAAEQAEREAAELAARVAAEQAERETAALAEQKAARDEPRPWSKDNFDRNHPSGRPRLPRTNEIERNCGFSERFPFG
jgi:hypothetical protein